MGAIIKKLGSKKVINRTTGKPFPESIQQHMKAGDKRRAAMKKAGYKGPKHEFYEKKPGSYRVNEVWKYNPYKEGKKSTAKQVAKKVAPIAAAMVGSSAAGYYGGKKSKKK